MDISSGYDLRQWQLRYARIERIATWFEAGRLCAEGDCFRRAHYAVTVLVGRRRIAVGLCRRHLSQLHHEVRERGRRRRGLVNLDDIIIDPEARKLGRCEVLNGPAIE